MVTFIAIYRGAEIDTAKMVAVSADPDLVVQVVSQLLESPQSTGEAVSDPVLASLDQGRRQALRLIRDSAK